MFCVGDKVKICEYKANAHPSLGVAEHAGETVTVKAVIHLTKKLTAFQLEEYPVDRYGNDWLWSEKCLTRR